MEPQHRVAVSEALKLRIGQLRGSSPWADFPACVLGWQWTGAYANKIFRGAQVTVPLAVYRVLDVKPSAITITLENVDEVDIAPAALAVLVHKFKLESCQVAGCDVEFYRTVWNQKYCPEHSWATPAGRAYWRSRAGAIDKEGL